MIKSWATFCWLGRWLGICLMAVLSGCQPSRHTSRQLDVLFIAYDQGESNAFLQLEKPLQQRQINYRFLAFGRAGEIFRKHPYRLQANVQNQKLLKSDRTRELSSFELDKIVRPLRPGIVYTGMSSVIQAQLTNAFKDKGSYTIAYYDSFDPVGGMDFVQPFLNNSLPPNEYHIPSIATRSSFDDLPAFDQSLLTVSGSPALEAWDKIYQQTNTDVIRQDLYIDRNRPVVVFAGGYEPTYKAHLRVFVLAAKSMPFIQFLVTYHPKTDGSLEREVVKELAPSNVRVINKGRYTTTALSKMAQVVVVHKSSIAPQALYKNKPVLYVAEPEFSNFLTQKKLAFVASSTEQVKNKLLSIIKADSDSSSLDSIGIPDNASLNIARILQLRLQDDKKQK